METPFTKAAFSRLLEVRGLRLVVRDPGTPGLLSELRSGRQVAFYVVKRRSSGGPLRVRKVHQKEISTIDADSAQNTHRQETVRSERVANWWERLSLSGRIALTDP